MKILSIQQAKFHVGAVVQEKGDGTLTCDLLDDFNDIEATYEASRNRILEYFKQVAAGGPQALNTAQCHQVDANNKIYEFIAGKLRVLFFQSAKGNLVICTHMFLKKTQKTPPKDVNKAIRAKKEYEKAENSGLVDWRKQI
ncbi:type II toxin-antitoxin system RelE/ParE family toxin [Rhodoferax sp. TBRC 17660]|uniref:Type II toxin-antitoxin system RelE/ParE family toxin n=1 Tax=Rhodoferax potami TaxID=3068338 RepID=A0ABU3KMF8_9BURK|nr:type II toxin-antitoxin system RelE/ParE family toxin [Rhodoferax sp. TBRC 17660]MDT7518995.1 type II toxin-antitoxin system RelE/ParE family toxin [Rhodoferax sp. TBRC 17660]